MRPLAGYRSGMGRPVTLVQLADVEAAAARIAGHVVRTQLVPWSDGDRDRPLWLKPENLQVIGAFKIRGAVNAVAALDPEARARGVVTHSSGNHAQALALAARRHGVKAHVVMPTTSPAVKVEATRALGADVTLVPPAERATRVAELVAEHGYTFIPPFDHPDVIAGQGTIGLEIVTDLPEVATVLVPVGGGGLVAGVATAIKARAPQVRVIACEPELAGDVADSMRHGERRVWPVDQTYRTIADSLRVSVGELTWEHIRARVDGVLTVSEDAIRAAVVALATRARLVAEPGGAVATAAYLEHRADLPPGPVVAVVSGGNIDPALLASLLAG
ncbi:threonine dehydratase [Thermasporomyces composti]|uniref:threonine ammonia-lyase n=2 Tax=Thermasporomyces composti TaxID=696763 RepID=A0A3D9V5Q6_THECX|nr:threonine dehydratase [Thermasporomyces composti]